MHGRAKLVVRFRHRIGDHPRKLRHARELELERRPLAEEHAQSLEVTVADFGCRQPRVVKRERERNVLRNPLRIQRPVRQRQLRIHMLEHKRDGRLQRSGFHVCLRAGRVKALAPE